MWWGMIVMRAGLCISHFGGSSLGLRFGSSLALPAGLICSSSSVTISSSISTLPCRDQSDRTSSHEQQNNLCLHTVSSLFSGSTCSNTGHQPLRRFFSKRLIFLCLGSSCSRLHSDAVFLASGILSRSMSIVPVRLSEIK